MIFECTFTYMAPDPNSTNGNYKKFVDVIAVQAENYMDAETEECDMSVCCLNL